MPKAIGFFLNEKMHNCNCVYMWKNIELFYIYILHPRSKFFMSKYGSSSELVTKCLSQEEFKKMKYRTMSYMSTISSSTNYSNMLAITFKFNRNFPVQILKVTMEFMTIASLEFLLRTQRTRLLFI